MSMSDVIQELKALLDATVVASGDIGRVYVGIVSDERMVALTDYPFIALDLGGEVAIETAVMVEQAKQYNVQIQLGVRAQDPEAAVLEICPLWDAIEDLIYGKDNRRLVVSGVRIVDAIENFMDVEDGEMDSGSTTANAWKWRKSVIPYRTSICRGGYHSP